MSICFHLWRSNFLPLSRLRHPRPTKSLISFCLWATDEDTTPPRLQQQRHAELRRSPRLKRTVLSPHGHYSFFNVTVGSRREARTAGSAAARIATAINIPAAESNVGASLALTL